MPAGSASLLLLVCVAQLAASAPDDSNRLSLIWPRAMTGGSTSVVWLFDAGAASSALLNVTVRLSDAERVFTEKSVVSQPGSVSALELAVPARYAGQLTVRVHLPDGRRQEVPVHPLDAVQSLAVRTERALYRPDDVVAVWLACVDHGGRLVAPSSARLAADVGVQVAVHDPNNVIVRYWSVPFSSFASNMENLSFHLSGEPLLTGDWTVRASVGDVTAVESFRVTNQDHVEPETVDPPVEPADQSLSIESHFVELSFSPRTASVIQQGAPFAGELVAGTSERGISVGLDVLDGHGASLHRQAIHLNRTSSVAFTVPALANLTTNATLQGTLQSIDGQALDNQFVLATRPLAVVPRGAGPCSVQLFSTDGRYRFAEGELLSLAVYSSCPMRGERVSYAVTSGSGAVVSWGQERVVEAPAASSEAARLVQLNLSVPIVYEMMPRAIVTVFFPRDEGRIASGSLDFAVAADTSPSKIEASEVRGNRVKLNVTLSNQRERHCLFGSTGESSDEDEAEPAFISAIEPDGFLQWLPKYQRQQSPQVARKLFAAAGDLWYARCFSTAAETDKELDIAVPASGGKLTLVALDAEGRMRRSPTLQLKPRRADWTIDFELPASARVSEEVVVDVAVSNRQRNCSQVQLQMALTGSGVFVSNDKTSLEQPACLAAESRAVYRVGIRVTPDPSKSGDVSLTVRLRGTRSASCCAPIDVVLLDAHVEPVETAPVTKSMRVSPKDFEHRQIDSHLFCLDERTLISNASSFSYEIVPLGSGVRSVVFQAASTGELRLALGDSHDLNGDSNGYRVVLGGEDNAFSWVSKQTNGLTEVKAKVGSPRLLRPDRLQTFWISWDQMKSVGRKKRNNNNKPGRKDHASPASLHNKRPTGTLALGRGAHVGARVLLSIPLEAKEPEAAAFRFIGFSTGWGFRGFFRVWGTDGSRDQTIRTLVVPKPEGAVHRLKAELTIKGGLMSVMDDVWSAKATPPTLEGVLERFYRGRIASAASWARDRAEVRDASASGLPLMQNVLYFRSADGSFRGDANEAPNLRLTALAVHALSSIQTYSDPSLLKSSLSWLHARQNDDGSFGESNEDRIVTTSFILSALSDVQLDDITLYQVCSAARRFLEAQLASASTVQLIVPSAAAVLLSHSPFWPDALAKLDGAYDRLLECHDRRGCLGEMTYALAAYFHENRHEMALDLMRRLAGAPWEALHPTDKVRAMKAWSKYHQTMNDPVRHLNVHIAFQNGSAPNVNESLPVPFEEDEVNETRSVEASDESVRLHTPPLIYEVPELPQNIETTITGAGCAVVQTKVHWSTVEPPLLHYSPISVFSNVTFTTPADRDEPPSQLAIDLCIRWNGNETSDLRVRTTLFSSYVISNPVDVDYNARYNYVSASLQIKPQCARCVRLRAARRGLVRNMQPGRVLIYESGRPHERHEFVLRGPANSTLWTSSYYVSDDIRYLRERPVTCS